MAETTPTISDRSTEAAGKAKEVGETARDQAGRMADEAMDKGRDVMHDAKHELRRQGDEQARRASGALHDFSGQLHQMSRQGDQQGLAPQLAREAAQRSEQLARRIDDGGLDGLIDDVQRYARRQPGMFLLGAAIAGFAVGRLVRNSDKSRLQQAATGDEQTIHLPGESSHQRDLTGSTSGRLPSGGAGGTAGEYPIPPVPVSDVPNYEGVPHPGASSVNPMRGGAS